MPCHTWKLTAQGMPSLFSVCLLWNGNVCAGSLRSLHFRGTLHTSFQRSTAEGNLPQDIYYLEPHAHQFLWYSKQMWEWKLVWDKTSEAIEIDGIHFVCKRTWILVNQGTVIDLIVYDPSPNPKVVVWVWKFSRSWVKSPKEWISTRDTCFCHHMKTQQLGTNFKSSIQCLGTHFTGEHYDFELPALRTVRNGLLWFIKHHHVMAFCCGNQGRRKQYWVWSSPNFSLVLNVMMTASVCSFVNGVFNWSK